MSIKKTKRIANEVDAILGRNLSSFRKMRGMTQQGLASSVGITFQQIQKYENASNRVSASRLYDFSNVLDVPVMSFYQGLQTSSCDKATLMLTKEELLFINDFRSINDKDFKRSLKRVMESLSESREKS